LAKSITPSKYASNACAVVAVSRVAGTIPCSFASLPGRALAHPLFVLIQVSGLQRMLEVYSAAFLISRMDGLEIRPAVTLELLKCESGVVPPALIDVVVQTNWGIASKSVSPDTEAPRPVCFVFHIVQSTSLSRVPIPGREDASLL
jgi:hypothetical protein